jgi:hypothetical protein
MINLKSFCLVGWFISCYNHGIEYLYTNDHARCNCLINVKERLRGKDMSPPMKDNLLWPHFMLVRNWQLIINDEWIQKKKENLNN